MVTVGAVLVVTPHSLFEGFECNYRLDSPLSVLVRCDNSGDIKEESPQ